MLDRCGRLLAGFVGGCCPCFLLCWRAGGCRGLGVADVALEQQYGGRPNGLGLKGTCLGPGGYGSSRAMEEVVVGCNEERFGRGRVLLGYVGLDRVVGSSRFVGVEQAGELGRRMLIRIVGAGHKLFGSSTVAAAPWQAVAGVETVGVLIVGKGGRCSRGPCRRAA